MTQTNENTIPEDWQEVKLNEIIKIKKGKTQSPLFDNKVDSSLPHILVESFDGNYKRFTTSKNGVLCSKNEILTIWDGSRFGLVAKNLEGYVGSTIGILTPINNLNKDYLYYFLEENYNNIRKTTAGSGIPHIDKNYLLSLKICLFSIKKQQKIASILTSVDDLIEQTQRTLENNQVLKKGLMNELLTKGIGHKEFKKIKLGLKEIETPIDWGIMNFGEFTKMISKKNTDKQITNVVSVTKYDGIVDSLEYFKKQVYSKELGVYKIIKKYQFAYATIHLEEGSIGYLDIYDEAVLSPMYTVFELDKSKVNRNFFFALSKSNTLMRIYNRIGEGTVDRRKSIPFELYSKIEIPIPPIKEQKQISQILQTIDNKIELEQKKKQYLQRLKKGLMQQLLTGKIRVEVKE